jgi:hypothetical protein
MLLFTVKIIPPPCAQGLDFMLKACVIFDENSDTCRKFMNNYRNFDTFHGNNRKIHSLFLGRDNKLHMSLRSLGHECH